MLFLKPLYRMAADLWAYTLYKFIKEVICRPYVAKFYQALSILGRRRYKDIGGLCAGIEIVLFIAYIIWAGV